MNSERRRKIDDLSADLSVLGPLRDRINDEMAQLIRLVSEKREEIEPLLEDLKSKVDHVASEIEEVEGEEQDYYDNMPEGFQRGEKGEAAQAAITALSAAKDHLRWLTDYDLPDFELHEDEIETEVDKIDDARASLEEAVA